MRSKAWLFSAPPLLMLGMLSISVYNAPGTGDFGVWFEWINLMKSQGFYATLVQINDNYPPFSLMLLDAVLHLSQWTGLSIFFWLKTSLLVGLLSTTAVFYGWTRNRGLAIGLYLALLVNVGCGYLDVYWTVSLVAALWALHRNNFALAAALYTLSVMTKPQPILAAPFMALYALNICSWRDYATIDWKRVGKAAAGCLAVLGLFTLRLGWAAFAPLVNAMDTTGQHGYSNATPSGNSFNANWILTHALHVWNPAQFGPLDHGAASYIPSIGLAWQLPFKTAFAGLFLYVLYRFFREEKTMKSLLQYSALGALTCVMFNTGMHENHLYVVPLLTVGLAAIDDRFWGLNAFWLTASTLNLAIIYGIGGSGIGYSRVAGIDLALVFSLANISIYAVSLASMFAPQENPNRDHGLM